MSPRKKTGVMDPVKEKRPEKFLLSSDERAVLAREISEAGGAEVLSAATVQNGGGWGNLRILARGTTGQAPAILRGLRPGDILLHNHPSGNLTPSSADMQIASICGQSGIGFAVHDSGCKNAYVVVEPFKAEVAIPLNRDQIAALFEVSGPIACLLPKYEPRPGQIGLLDSVIEAINTPRHAILEGETGIGKSLAYLVPAIFFAIQNKCRVAVSTNTINLQQQLCQKDLPFLQKALPFPFTFCLIKGRGNYLCMRRMREIIDGPEGDVLLEMDELEQFNRLQVWSEKTTDGSLADLNWVPEEKLWEKLNAERDSCIGVKCEFYNPCFCFSARRKAAEADILVVNHHLLFTDLALRAAMQEYEQTAIIPGYRVAILDEAHNLEEIATGHFGFRTTALGFQRLLGKLYQRRSNREKGFVPVLQTRLESGAGPFPRDERDLLLKILLDEIIPLRMDAGNISGDLFDLVSEMVLGRSDPFPGDHRLRIGPAQESTELYSRIVETAKKFDSSLKDLMHAIRKLLKKFSVAFEDDNSDRKIFEVPLTELGSLAQRFGNTRDALSLVFDETSSDREKYVHFFSVSVRGRSRFQAVHSAPLSVAETMLSNCFKPISCVILVSGTLSTRGNFDFIQGRLGLDNPEIIPEPLTGRFPSPFNYEFQSRLFIPNELPDPGSPEFLSGIENPAFEIVCASRGGALILCTSHVQIQHLSGMLSGRFQEAGLECYRQGELERHHLLDRFREDGNGVLFATDSFWEGIDVPGSALRNLIIIKLPFAVPDDPVLQARQELLKEEGRNPFVEYQLPMAAIKLKQGFGRLIRHKDDRGTVWILDKRLITKHYGSFFLESLPPAKMVCGHICELLTEARKFFR